MIAKLQLMEAGMPSIPQDIAFLYSQMVGNAQICLTCPDSLLTAKRRVLQVWQLKKDEWLKSIEKSAPAKKKARKSSATPKKSAGKKEQTFLDKAKKQVADYKIQQDINQIIK